MLPSVVDSNNHYRSKQLPSSKKNNSQLSVQLQKKCHRYVLCGTFVKNYGINAHYCMTRAIQNCVYEFFAQDESYN